MNYTLRPARQEDLRAVLQWIDSPESLKLWGGPVLTYPPNPELTWDELKAAEENTFALVDENLAIAGFGQTLCREEHSVHLARIIVSPAIRGRGIGRILCSQLMQRAVERYNPTVITLNVYTANAPALSLYRSLGFSPVTSEDESGSIKMQVTIGSAHGPGPAATDS